MSFDQSLVKRIQRRDQKAFGELYSQTVDQLYRYVTWRYSLPKQEIQDLLSEFYLKLWRVIDKYDDSYKFESFFWAVFRNMLKDHFKKHKEIHDSIEVNKREYSNPDDMLQSIQWSFQIEAIQRAMKQLDEISYQIIILRYIESQSYEEIWQYVNLDEQAVRQRLSRALKKVKNLLS